MRTISDESCRENQNTHFAFNNFFFFFENRAVYEIRWKNFAERGRPQMTIWRMLIACWITKATDTHSEYVILIAFPLATVVARTRLNASLHVHFLSCLTLAKLLRVFFIAGLICRRTEDVAAAWPTMMSILLQCSLRRYNVVCYPLCYRGLYRSLRRVKTASHRNTDVTVFYKRVYFTSLF